MRSSDKSTKLATANETGYEESLGQKMDETIESRSPRDTQGHGTHTASTAAGAAVTGAGFYNLSTGEAKGIATKARIAAYKICWLDGCLDSDILAAMDQAINDGVHVISIFVSLDMPALSYDKDSISIGSFGAVQAGILVSASAGNDGPVPGSVMNIAPWILTVGASTVDREFPADVVLGDGSTYGVSLYAGEPLDSSDLPLVDGGYCVRIRPTTIRGKIVLCNNNGDGTVINKGDSIQQAGGVGMIIADTLSEYPAAELHFIPATGVGKTVGDSIRSYIRSEAAPTATIIFKGTVIGAASPAYPKVARFSSRGPTEVVPEILKPDVIAPGVNILASWSGFSSPTDLDIDPRRVEFNIQSGTSMACPNVSGLAALLWKRGEVLIERNRKRGEVLIEPVSFAVAGFVDLLELLIATVEWCRMGSNGGDSAPIAVAVGARPLENFPIFNGSKPYME